MLNIGTALQYRRAWGDIAQGVRLWRIWWLLGISDVRRRYSRSKLGQFWITLSMAIFVLAIGFLYAAIFRQSIADYLPYLTTNFIVWTLISGIIVDGNTAFMQAEAILRQEPLPKTVFVLRVLVRNFVSFLHNIILVPLIFFAVGLWLSWTWLLVPIGLLLVAIAGFLTALVCGLLCTRFRDLPQIISNALQVAFFVSPVTWPITALAQDVQYLVGLNPFAAFLRVVAEPMRGQVPGVLTYVSTLVTILALAAVAIPLFARFRARLVYWL